MKKTITVLLSILTILSTALTALAQSDAGAQACGCGVGIVMLIVYVLILALALAVPVVIIVFVIKYIKKDATDRGMPNADSVKWFGLLGLLGLVIYLLQRSQGNVVPCPSCNQGRMQGLPTCPHCGRP